MRYRVHVYAVVRVPVWVEASCQKEAVAEAIKPADEHLRQMCHDGLIEDAEETVGYLVDEEGDGEYARSRTYTGAGNRTHYRRLGRKTR